MLQAATTPLSQMSPAQMRAVYEHLAKSRGQPMPKRGADRVTLAKGIALLRTYRPVAPPVKPSVAKVDRRRNRAAPLRMAVLEELARVTHYKQGKTSIEAHVFEGLNYPGEWQTVGLSYADVLTAVRQRLPNSRVTADIVRGIAYLARKADPANSDLYDVVLPDIRPHATRKESKCPTLKSPARSLKHSATRRLSAKR